MPFAIFDMDCGEKRLIYNNRVFDDAKEKHSKRWTTLRGLKKLSMQECLHLLPLYLIGLAHGTYAK
jgi:hypothetical protein